MARIRTIKPEFWQNESLAECSPHARLLAIAILQLADSEGRFRWLPMQVHAHAFPFEPKLKIDSLASELEQAGYLIRYSVDGREYAEIPNFLKHQRLTGKEASVKSKIPPRETKGKDQMLPREAPRCPGKGKGTGEESENKFTDADMETAKFIFKKIKSLAPKTKEPNFEKWADTIRLMRERDDLTDDEIRDVFLYANNDSFWQSNILSPVKLREQFSRLQIQAGKGGNWMDDMTKGAI